MDRFFPKGDIDMGSSGFDGPELRQLWDRARTSLTRNPKDPPKRGKSN